MTTTEEHIPINHNKGSDDAEIWSDSHVDLLFNALNSNHTYKDQALEKFEYFRLESPAVYYKIDIDDLPEDVKRQLEYCIKDCNTVEEKYETLNEIFVETITLIYGQVAPKILAGKKDDRVEAEKAINEIHFSLSHHWMLIGPKQTLPPSSCLDELIEYTPSSMVKEASEKQQNDDDDATEEKTDEIKTQIVKLIEIIQEKTRLLFKDQYGEPFAKIVVKDHFEIISTKSHKFKRFLSKIYFEKYKTIVNSESITNVAQMLQAKAEFGDVQYSLSLRVAEYNEDIYYDLTNEKHQCIRISSDGKWQILDKTPIPLFRRYNQSSQDIPDHSLLVDNKSEDLLETFFLKMTNIKDPETKLLAKITLLSYFIPNIPHIILMIHGGKGSAKSTFQLFLKSIVDPAKPSLLTLHDNHTEFIQQLAHNYLGTYDNMKYVPRWLSDEVCKAVTGVGQTKRSLYTDDEDKIYEYKHCLNFNGINVAFSEPDVLDRSIIIELAEIEDEDRKTEQEILNEFYALRPKLLTFIFDVLAKAIVIKPSIKIKKLPRMADFAIWGEAIARALGYKENEFIRAYYNKIGFQNHEAIDSNTLAFALKKFVEKRCEDVLNNETLFEGTPSELLAKLNDIANQEGMDTNQREWPKNRIWLVKRIKIIKSNIQQVMGIKITIRRDSNNSSIIKIERNISGNSGERAVSPDNESLSPYFDSLSPVSGELSPEDTKDLSTKSCNPGDTGDSFDILEEENGERELETDIDRNQTASAGNSNIIENIKGLPDTVTTVTDSKDGSSNNIQLLVSSVVAVGQGVGIEENDSNNASILNSNDGLKTIDNNYDSDLTIENYRLNPKIGQKGSFYYCKKHPEFESIHLEEVEKHLLYSKAHSQEHPEIPSYHNRDKEIQSKDIVHIPT